jgi:hypothetical protein
VRQWAQRTTLPRAESGAATVRPHLRLGQIIVTVTLRTSPDRALVHSGIDRNPRWNYRRPTPPAR